MPSRFRKAAVLALILPLTVIAFSACTHEGEKLKDKWLKAAATHEHIVSYRFRGGLELDAPPHLLQEALPPQVAAIAMGTWTWRGTVNRAENKLELIVEWSREGNMLTVPLLLMDDKLYFKIPALPAAEGEYWSLDADAVAGGADVFELGTKLVRAAGDVIGALDGRRFVSGGSDDAGASRIRIPLSDKTLLPILADVVPVWPDLLGKWSDAGIIRQPTADQLKAIDGKAITGKFERWKFGKPGEIVAYIDKEGRWAGSSIHIELLTDDPLKKAAVRFDYHLEDIDRNPAFALAPPTSVIPLPFGP